MAARQCFGLTVEVVGEVQQAGGFFHALADFFLVHLGELQREAHVFGHGHVRVESVVLEDHGDVAVFRIGHGDVIVADQNLPRVHKLQTGQHAQGGRFTTAGGADEYQEFAVVNI